MSCEPALLTIVKQATLVREYLALDTSKTKRVLKVLLVTFFSLHFANKSCWLIDRLCMDDRLFY